MERNAIDLFASTADMPGLFVPEGPKQKLLLPFEGNDYVLRIDNSTLEKMTTCARSLEYSNVFGRVPYPKSALTYGSALHAGLEYYYTSPSNLAKGTPERREMYGRMIEVFQKAPPISDWRTPERAMDCIDDYIDKFPRELADFEVLVDFEGKPMVEIPFSLPLAEIVVDGTLGYPRSTLVADCEPDNDEPFYVRNIHVFWTGKIDMIVRSGGQVWVWDNKTSSINTGNYYDDFVLSSQTVGYTWAGTQILQEPVTGLMLNVLMGRPKTRTGTHQSFDRRRYFYPKHRLEEWELNTVLLVGDLINYLRIGKFPMMTKWCIGKYGRCPYHTVCAAPAGERHTILNNPNDFVDNVWNPLASIVESDS